MPKAKVGASDIAVAYVRASTQDQRLSPAAQRDAITAWAKGQGVKIAAWHIDYGVSGSAPLEARPALLAALGALREHRAGVLVVLRRDRLARDVAVAASIDAAARGKGARVVTANGTGNGDRPEDAFMRNILDATSAYERAILAERTRAALQAKKARGERVGCIPYGYRLGVNAARLEPDPPEQAVIRRVHRLSRTMTVRAIAKELQKEGVKGRTGKPLSHIQVWRIKTKENGNTNGTTTKSSRGQVQR